MKEERHCATCANWIPKELAPAEGTESPLSSLGECHRYAPRPLILARQAATDAQLVWPSTRAADVCGEWYYGGLRLKQQPAMPSEPPEDEPPSLLASSDTKPDAPPRRFTT